MRTNVVRSIQGVLIVSAMAVLTGAKDNGCGGSQGGGTSAVASSVSVGAGGGMSGSAVSSTGSGEVCPPGTTPEMQCFAESDSIVCNGMGGCEGSVAVSVGAGGASGCNIVCVPDDPCGPMGVETWVCDGGGGCGYPGDPGDPNTPPSMGVGGAPGMSSVTVTTGGMNVGAGGASMEEAVSATVGGGMNCYPVCEPITPPCMIDEQCGPEGYCVDGSCEQQIEPDAKPGKHVSRAAAIAGLAACNAQMTKAFPGAAKAFATRLAK